MKGIRKTGAILAVLLPLVLFAVACGPEKLVQWAPDGQRAAVIANGSLLVADEQGNLSRPIAEGVSRMAWLPDSAQALVVVERKVKSWDEVVRLAPVELNEKEIVPAAQAVVEELTGYTGKLDDFKPSNASALTGEQWAAALLYIKSRGDLRLKQKLGEKEWKDVEELEVEVRSLRIVSMSAGTAGDGRDLLTTMAEIGEPRISPDGAAAAIVAKRTHGWFGSSENVLSVMLLSPGSTPKQVAEGVSGYPDWTADGSALVFVRDGSKQDQDSGGETIGIVGMQTVRDKAGALTVEMPPAVDLARVLFRDSLKVRCLRDGRILFSGHEVSLPAVAGDFPGRINLYEIQTGTTVTVKHLLPASAEQRLPDRVDLFELSPDQKRIAVPGSKGRVSLISLEKGEIVPVVDKDGPNDIPTLPVWRNNDQLCVAVPAGSPLGSARRPEIILWGQGQPRTISLHWTESAIPWLK